MLERDDALVKEAFHKKKQCARTSKRSPIERSGFPPVIPGCAAWRRPGSMTGLQSQIWIPGSRKRAPRNDGG